MPLKADRDPVEKLAEEFLDRFRRGERPALIEYTDANPDLADQIRDVFPALVLMEQMGSDAENSSGSAAGQITADGRPLEQIGDYRVIREIGRGGMGVVYEAEQESLGRHVALKVLPFHSVMDPRHLERFKREARAAARLHHTNIVPVFGVGEHSGLHFFAMQFIQGQGLDLVIAELHRLRSENGSLAGPAKKGCESQPQPAGAHTGSIAQSLLTGAFSSPTAANAGEKAPGAHPTPAGKRDDAVCDTSSIGTSAALTGSATHSSAISTREFYFQSVARIGVQVADALGYAHDQGVLHRDIKPSNLLLDAHGTVWIMDFGLAKADGTEDVTNTGDLVGTLRYMAPERFRGESGPSSDVYGLGVTLYELLTLRPAFDSTDRAELIRLVTREDPPRPRKLDRRIPSDLETIVLKAIDKDPLHRYGSATELADDLRRLLADLPIQARRALLPERAWRLCRRNPAVASLATALMLLATVGSTVSALWLRQERNVALTNLMRAEHAESETKDRLQQVERAEEGMSRQLFESLLNQARARRWSGQVGQRFESLNALAKAAKLAHEMALEGRVLELRNEAIACLALADVRRVREWEGYPLGSVAGVAWDAELDHYARTDRSGNISIRRVSDDVEMACLPGPGTVANLLQFSPDGSRLAALHDESIPGRQTNLVVWDWSNLKPGFYSSVRVEQFAVAFSPDSRRIAVGREKQGHVFIHDLGTGAEVLRFDCPFVPFRIAFNPAGDQLAVAGNGLEVRAGTTGKRIRQLKPPAFVYDVSWDADGRRLVTACEKEIYIWDAQSGRQLGVLRGHQATVVGARFNHDGDVLVSSAWDGTSRLWDVATEHQLLSMPSCFNRESDWETKGLTTSSGPSLQHWKVSLGREYRSWSGTVSGGGVHSAALSPDGRWLVLATDQGVRVWDVWFQRQQTFLEIGRTVGVVFHPTGESLFTSGSAGLQRWPIVVKDGVQHVGPPQKLPVSGPLQRVDIDAAGHTLAVVGGNQSQIWYLDSGQPPVPPLSHAQAVFIKLSPDAKWVVTGPWNGRGVKVWDARSGQLDRDLLPDADTATIEFSPDGRTLVTAQGHASKLWDVNTWQLVREIPTVGSKMNLAFSRDGRLLAICVDPHTIELRETKHWDQVASLRTPSQELTGLPHFSADGSQLFVVSGSPQRIRSWDLRSIRTELAAMGLDWDQLPYPPAMPTESRIPLVARIDLGKPAAPTTTLTAAQRLQKDVERLTRDIESDSTKAKSYYDRAAAFDQLTQRDQADADFRRALELYGRDIDANPDDPAPYHYRGHIHFRFRDDPAAVLDFTNALAGNPNDLHLLNARAQSFNRQEKALEAIQDYTRIIELSPENADAYLQRALLLGQRSECRQAAADYEKHLALKPDSALARNNLAWLLVTGPAEDRNPPKALSLAERAVQLAPKQCSYVSTLGAVYYRLSKYGKAIETFDKAANMNPDGATAFELFFQAMSHHQLADPVKAKDCYDRAVNWRQAQAQLPPTWAAELKTIQAEADALLAVQ